MKIIEKLPNIKHRIKLLESEIDSWRDEIRIIEKEICELKELSKEARQNSRLEIQTPFRPGQVKGLKEYGLLHIVQSQEVEARKHKFLLEEDSV